MKDKKMYYLLLKVIFKSNGLTLYLIIGDTYG